MIEESRHLKQELSNVSSQKVKTLQSKLNTANEMINKLNDNLKNATVIVQEFLFDPHTSLLHFLSNYVIGQME